MGKHKWALKDKLDQMIGMPVDRHFKDILKYTVFNTSKLKLNIVDTADINGFITFLDVNGRTRVKIEIQGISERDYRFFEKTGLGNVIGTVKKAYIVA